MSKASWDTDFRNTLWRLFTGKSSGDDNIVESTNKIQKKHYIAKCFLITDGYALFGLNEQFASLPITFFYVKVADKIDQIKLIFAIACVCLDSVLG